MYLWAWNGNLGLEGSKVVVWCMRRLLGRNRRDSRTQGAGDEDIVSIMLRWAGAEFRSEDPRPSGRKMGYE